MSVRHKFKPGDVVRLRCEETHMVVNSVYEQGSVAVPEVICHCFWLDAERKVQCAPLDQRTLEKA